MQKFSGTSLKTRLYVLVLVAFIPVAVLIFYIAEEQREIETAAILQKAMVLAHVAADEENQLVASARGMLTAVAEAFVMVQDRIERMSGFLAAVMHQSDGYADLGVAAPDGRVLASVRKSGEAANLLDKAWFESCLRRKDLAMGSYRSERIGDRPVLYFALPALDKERQVMAVAFAAFDLNWINRTIFRQLAELPKGSRLTLLDQTRGMLRYDVDAGSWSVPERFDATLRRRITDGGAGTFSAVDEAGELRIFAYAPLASAFRQHNMAVVLEIPQALALATSRRIFTRNVTLLVISALIAVISIWWAGNVFILRRVHEMVRVSRKLAAGDLGARIGKIGVRDELSHLAGVFDEMAAALQNRIEREQRVMASLEQSREQLRRLSAYQQQVREEERHRIAREIHDQFGQSLTILKMDLTWMKKHFPDRASELDAKMEAMAQVIGEALETLHAVTAELRPVMLDDFGLSAAIEWQVEEFRKRSGIDCRMEETGFEPDLPKDQAAAIFRIFQETLTNIMRHAKADRVEVRLAHSKGDLLLEVRDNGRGITEEEINAPTSFGLLGMRERLYPWNGRVSFEGHPGKGTRVSIRLPLPLKGEDQ
ncbi:MAG: histidine kinase [Desulfobacteraceae bacterium]